MNTIDDAAVLLLAGPRRSEEPGPRLLLVAPSSRSPNDGGKTTHATPRRACTSTTTACGSTRTIPSIGRSANDGGIAITLDRGGNFFYPMNLPDRPVLRGELRLCGAVQHLRRRAGQRRVVRAEPAQARPVTNVVLVHDRPAATASTRRRIRPSRRGVYGESQGGNISRAQPATGADACASPSRRGGRATRSIEDSIVIARGDPLQPATQDVDAAHRAAARARRRRTRSTLIDCASTGRLAVLPLAAQPDVFYIGGNRVLKSTQARRRACIPISPDLSKQDAARIDTAIKYTGGITPDATGAETYGTVVDARRVVREAGLAARRHRRRQHLDDAQRRRRRGRDLGDALPRPAEQGRVRQRASSRRTSTR